MLNGRWIKLPAVVLIAASLAACGGGAGGSDPGSKASVAEQGGEGSGPGKKPSGEPVEIVFYSDNGDPQESFEYRYGDLLRKKFPQYKISYIQAQKGAYLNDLLMNGTKFDIFYATIGNFEWAMLENHRTESVGGSAADARRQNVCPSDRNGQYGVVLQQRPL